MESVRAFFTNKTVLTNLLTPPLAALLAYLATKGVVMCSAAADDPCSIVSFAGYTLPKLEFIGYCVTIITFVANLVIEHATTSGLTTPTAATHIGAPKPPEG